MGEWIRCDERMPKVDQRVIVYSGDLRRIPSEARVSRMKARWVDQAGVLLRYAPTHWMPMPEPPELIDQKDIDAFGAILSEWKEQGEERAEVIEASRRLLLALAEAREKLRILVAALPRPRYDGTSSFVCPMCERSAPVSMGVRGFAHLAGCPAALATA